MWFFLKDILLPLFLIILLISLSLISLVFVSLGIIQLIKDIILEFTDSPYYENDDNSLSEDELADTRKNCFTDTDY